MEPRRSRLARANGQILLIEDRVILTATLSIVSKSSVPPCEQANHMFDALVMMVVWGVTYHGHPGLAGIVFDNDDRSRPSDLELGKGFQQTRLLLRSPARADGQNRFNHEDFLPSPLL